MLVIDPRRVPGQIKGVGKGALSASGEVVRATGRSVDAALRSSETATVVSEVDDRIAALRRSRKFGRDSFRGLHVTVHRGYVVGTEARVHIRVTEAPVLDEGAAGVPYVDVLWLNLRKYAALSLPGVHLEVTIGEETVEAVTERHGVVAVTLPVPADLPSGWHEVRVTALPEGENEEPFVAVGRVLKPDPESSVAVVSDIDDTIIRTGITDRMTALRRSLFRDAHSRQAVPGMSSLYRGLSRGVRDEQGHAPTKRPFFYLSTGSWAFYEMLIQFQQLRAFPRGPLFLTTWGPTEKYVTRSGVEHKRTALRRLFDSYPDMSFLLVGDSGEADPKVYAEMARKQPERVVAIIIMVVDPDDEERLEQLRELREELGEIDVPMRYVTDARVAAEKVHSLGLCDAETLEEVSVEVSARI